jgi:hypothetical protein
LTAARPTVRAILLVTAATVGLAVSLASASARAASPAALAAQAASLADAISLDWSRSLDAHGSIVDPITGQAEGEYGATMLAAGMLRASARNPALGLGPLASQALFGSGHLVQSPFDLLGVSETLIAGGPLTGLAAASLQEALSQYPRYGSADPNTPCYKRIGCYDNLKLVFATATLAALRASALGGPEPAVGTVLADPRRTEREAQHLLVTTVARVEIPDGTLRVGKTRLTEGAVLSDPSRDPTAYLALSTTMLGRAIELLGAPAPATMLAFRRAVVALLGLVAPDGDISYMGRGQEQVWTMASAAAACAMAMRLLPAEAAIASRCEGLVVTELGALAKRRASGTFGIPVVPRVTWQRGVDHYVNRIDYNGLCVYLLNVLSDTLSSLADPGEAPVPGAVEGEWFTDPGGTGVATTQHGGTWLAVHRAGSDPGDSRWGFGLLAIKALRGGTWRSAMAARPLGPARQGPILLSRGHRYLPAGLSIAVPRRGSIEVVGGWLDGRRLVRRATFLYRATPQGVTLSVPTRRGDQLLVSEWVLPGQPGQLSVLGRGATGETVSRRRLRLGNADSDTLEEIDHLARTRRGGTMQFIWRVPPDH